MLASGSYEQLEFEHVEVKDPEVEKVDKEIKDKLGKIPSKFKAPAAKAPVKKAAPSEAKAPARVSRPTPVKPATIPRPQSGVRAQSGSRP